MGLNPEGEGDVILGENRMALAVGSDPVPLLLLPSGFHQLEYGLHVISLLGGEFILSHTQCASLC